MCAFCFQRPRYERTKINYGEHLKWLGLHFKKKHVELAYLDTIASRFEWIVYGGFGISLLILLCNDLVGFLNARREEDVCKDAELQEFCVENFLLVDNSSSSGSGSNETEYPLMYYDAVLLNEMGHHHFMHTIDAESGTVKYVPPDFLSQIPESQIPSLSSQQQR